MRGVQGLLEADKRKHLSLIISRLIKKYHNPKIALHYRNPIQLLVATILSAQCTDKMVNKVTKVLFEKYRSVEDYANAELSELEKDIRQTGFFRNKSKNIKNACKMLMEKFDGQVPNTMEKMLLLPGVARKTANVVLTSAYGVIEGIVVDTHVKRLSQRLGLTKNDNPEKIEKDLMNIVPKDKWAQFSFLLISHGRKICQARKPVCGECILNDLCPSRGE
ncbi:endonuclease III [bacterium]|nr:endonuclease III [bacterium]